MNNAFEYKALSFWTQKNIRKIRKDSNCMETSLIRKWPIFFSIYENDKVETILTCHIGCVTYGM